MSTDHKIRAIKRRFNQLGIEAMENARRHISSKYNDNSDLSEALRYFNSVTLNGALPVFPALISLACKAVGGRIENINSWGKAIVLISAAADLHDDVIDNSIMKKNKQTVFGKFGLTTTILSGDVLLVEGIMILSEAGKQISQDKACKVMKEVSDAVFEICRGEVLESQLRRIENLQPEEYREVVNLKAVVPELAMKIGATVGNGNSEEIEKLGQFGRIYGITSAMIEEFVDLLEIDELNNRLKNECLPAPIIYAIQDEKVRSIVNEILANQPVNKDVHEKIVDIVLESKEVVNLEKRLILDAKQAISQLTSINKKTREELEKILLVPLNYF